MPPRSKQLGTADSLGTGGTTLYTVPTGYRTIVKSVVFQNTAGSANDITVAIYSGTTRLAALVLFLTAAPSAGATLTWLPWIVLNAGQHLQVTPSVNSVHVIASGAELAL